MTVEVQAAATALVEVETVTTSHGEDDGDESDEESDCEDIYGGDGSEGSPEDNDYESNEAELLD